MYLKIFWLPVLTDLAFLQVPSELYYVLYLLGYLIIISRIIKTHGSELRGQENALAMITKSLFMRSKMHKKWKTKPTFLMFQSFLYSWNIFIFFL